MQTPVSDPTINRRKQPLNPLPINEHRRKSPNIGTPPPPNLPTENNRTTSERKRNKQTKYSTGTNIKPSNNRLRSETPNNLV